MHGLTANSTRQRYECKSLLGQFCANIGGLHFGQIRTASANKALAKMAV